MRAAPDATLLLDGVFLHRPELVGLFDFSIFLRVSFEETLRRARTRDLARFGSPAELERRYRTRYVPGQALYLAEARPERRASVVVDHDDPAAPRIVGESLS